MRACAGLVQPALSPGYSFGAPRPGVLPMPPFSHRFDVRSRPASTREARRQLGFTGLPERRQTKGASTSILDGPLLSRERRRATKFELRPSSAQYAKMVD